MNPEEVGQFLESKTYDYYLEQALSQVPDDIDKREGSIIYDALAPACYQLALFTFDLKNVLLNAFVQTAVGSYLDLKAEEHGIKRIPATQAYVKGVFTDASGAAYKLLNEGDRFSSIGEDPVYYDVVNQISEGTYTLKCEVTGSVGNQYIGQLLPIDHFNGLGGGKITEVTIPARDEEDDESLRARILKTYEVNQYGGNIEDYIRFTSQQEGVGAVQVYPAWNGGGTVRVVLLNSAFEVPNGTLINKVQEALDPHNAQKGYGVAPIGHLVTVAAPSKRTIDISLHVDTEVGTSLSTVQPLIKEAIEAHFLAIRKNWSSHNELYQYSQTVYRSQLIAAILKVAGVANVSNLRLGGKDADVVLTFNNSLQECAFVGMVGYT